MPRATTAPPNNGPLFRKQSHNAGRLITERVVTYPFHPFAGQTVTIFGEQEHDGVNYLLIRTPQGGGYHVPEWMFAPGGDSLEIVSCPRIPIQHLLEVRSIVNHLLASPADKTDTGGDDDNQDDAAHAVGSVRCDADDNADHGGGTGKGAGAITDAAERSADTKSPRQGSNGGER